MPAANTNAQAGPHTPGCAANAKYRLQSKALWSKLYQLLLAQ